MEFEENEKGPWEWQEEEYCLQRDPSTEISHCLWDVVDQKEDDLLYMLGEQTPIKDCATFGYLIPENGGKENKNMVESRDSSQLKRRRMLQFNSNDTFIGISDQKLASDITKSKIGEDSLMEDGTNDSMQWILGFSDSQGLGESSECWLASCFNESGMHFSSEEMNVSSTSDNHGDTSEHHNVSPRMKAVNLPVNVSITPCSKFKGKKSYISTPTKTAASVAYPFQLIKPYGVEGDITLKDINQMIHSPVLLKSKHMKDEDSTNCYLTSAFSGKPVVVKTKIHTEGGKGSITIMRTKG
uniref:Protein XRI1 n=1 Tax=Anthurium amnicola TaxID=1678845 RepID=A0A1D1Z4Y8_9ARAE